MDIDTNKSKTTVNTVEQGKAEIHLNGMQLEEVQSFKYLWATRTFSSKNHSSYGESDQDMGQQEYKLQDQIPQWVIDVKLLERPWLTLLEAKM